LKKIFFVAVVFIAVILSIILIASHIKESNVRWAVKPYVMFEDKLYGIYRSPYSNYSNPSDIPSYNKDALRFAGIIEEVTSERTPQKNFQLSDNSDSLKWSGIYVADAYPGYLFILDKDKEYWIFALDNADAGVFNDSSENS